MGCGAARQAMAGWGTQWSALENTTFERQRVPCGDRLVHTEAPTVFVEGVESWGDSARILIVRTM